MKMDSHDPEKPSIQSEKEHTNLRGEAEGKLGHLGPFPVCFSAEGRAQATVVKSKVRCIFLCPPQQRGGGKKRGDVKRMKGKAWLFFVQAPVGYCILCAQQACS